MNSPAARTALIVAATGLVGGCLLARLIDDPRYSAVTTLGRRAAAVGHGGRVELARQFSDAAGEFGVSRGYEHDHVWVDNDCRGEFGIYR